MALIDVNGKKFKNFMAKLYGWGAAVVILGAMFKILHMKGADTMLVVGLTTEAVIFFFSAFEKPGKEYDWSLVYPELAGIDDAEIEEEIMVQKSGGSLSAELDNMLAEAKIDQELIDSLGVGLRKFGEAATQLNTTVDAAAGTKEYGDQIKLAARNMESLNALYAVQLEGTSNHMEMQNALIEKLTNSMNSSEKLSEEVVSLVQNMSDLNRVYGGMLTAMNVNRA